MANPVLKTIELAIRRMTLRLIARFDTNRTSRTTDGYERLAQLGPSPSILLLRQDRLGDIVMSTPILIAIRNRFPNSTITVLLGKNNEQAAPLLPIHCNTVIYKKQPLRDLAMLRRLRKSTIDIAIDLTDKASVTSTFLLASVNAKINVGFEKENGVAYNIAIPRMSQHEVHISTRIASLLQVFGIPTNEIDLRPRLKLTAKPIAGRFGLNVSARMPDRSAPAAAAAAIALGALEQGASEVLVFAAPHDLDRGRDTVAKANDPRVHLATGLRSFADFANAIASCELLITVDTSAIQIAAAANIPMVLMFRPMYDERPWTPAGVPFELHTQEPSLADLQPEQVLMLLSKLRGRIQSLPTTNTGGAHAA